MSDPEEFTGTNQTVKAEALTAKKPGSHPKIAIVRPRKEYAAAQVELEAARVELREATADHRRCELAEGKAMADFIVLNPGPTYDQINRERLARENAARLERSKATGSPEAPKPDAGVKKSPLEEYAASRGRRPSTPLRSTTVRR